MEIEKNYIDNKIVELKKGEGIKIEVSKEKVQLVRDRMRRAQIYGIKMCFIKLYDNIYHMEKIEEGDGTSFLRRRRNDKKRIQRIKK